LVSPVLESEAYVEIYWELVRIHEEKGELIEVREVIEKILELDLLQPYRPVR
jgi:hypothetical protein